MIFAFIKGELAAAYPVDVACETLGVSRSGYYAWLGRPASARAERRESLATKIEAVHKENRGVYGSPRVHQALLADGASACVNTVADIMKEREIRARTKRPFDLAQGEFAPRTTDSSHGQPVAENVLDRDFAAKLPNEKWAVDITYIATDEGWMYLTLSVVEGAGVIDLCSRRIVGWSMADHMETSLVSDALRMPIARRCPGDGLLHHSDRGSQYTSDDYLHLLRTHEMESSMSGVGQCWDNAVKESFWATLKTELVHHEHYRTRAEARASIFEYIEVFYNRKRLHSSLRRPAGITSRFHAGAADGLAT